MWFIRISPLMKGESTELVMFLVSGGMDREAHGMTKVAWCLVDIISTILL